jgi:16S rRNA C1402 (ribose-2'-O) methylase RsmI
MGEMDNTLTRNSADITVEIEGTTEIENFRTGLTTATKIMAITEDIIKGDIIIVIKTSMGEIRTKITMRKITTMNMKRKKGRTKKILVKMNKKTP